VVYVESRFLSRVVTQEDIRQLDFAALRQAGYRGAVFDKDNCLVSLYGVLLGINSNILDTTIARHCRTSN
jgi:hypothetical protein